MSSFPPHPTTTIGSYIISHEIGRGSFATVYMGKHLTTQQPVAVKSVSRDKLNRKLAENLESEIRILRGLRHPNVVSLVDIVKTDRHIHLVMQYCSLGDLSNFIKKRGLVTPSVSTPTTLEARPSASSVGNSLAGPWGGLAENVVRNFIKQLASALEFLRQHELVHRDLKPQNVLLHPSPESATNSNALPTLLLADFGFARLLPSTSLASTLCGSPLYMAPEILRGDKYDAKADLWSFGAIVYEMLCGRPPYKAMNHVELLRKIERTGVKFPGEDTTGRERGYSVGAGGSGGGSLGTSPRFPGGLPPIPEDLKDLIKRLLKRDPKERLGFEEFFALPVVGITAAQSASSGSGSRGESYPHGVGVPIRGRDDTFNLTPPTHVHVIPSSLPAGAFAIPYSSAARPEHGRHHRTPSYQSHSSAASHSPSSVKEPTPPFHQTPPFPGHNVGGVRDPKALPTTVPRMMTAPGWIAQERQGVLSGSTSSTHRNSPDDAGMHPSPQGYHASTQYSGMTTERPPSQSGRVLGSGDSSHIRRVSVSSRRSFALEDPPPFSSVENMQRLKKQDMAEDVELNMEDAPFPHAGSAGVSVDKGLPTGKEDVVPAVPPRVEKTSSLSSIESVDSNRREIDSPGSASSAGRSGSKMKGSDSGMRGSGSDEYVMVEKRVVEVNWLADVVEGVARRDSRGSLDSLRSKASRENLTGTRYGEPAHNVVGVGGGGVIYAPTVTVREQSLSREASLSPSQQPQQQQISSVAAPPPLYPATSTSPLRRPSSRQRILGTGSLRESTHQFLNTSHTNLAAIAGPSTPTPSNHESDSGDSLLLPLNTLALRAQAIQSLAASLESEGRYEEAMGTYMMALRGLQRGVEVARGIFEAYGPSPSESTIGNTGLTGLSASKVVGMVVRRLSIARDGKKEDEQQDAAGMDVMKLSKAVSWLRERFNECLEGADRCRVMIEDVGVSDETGVVVASQRDTELYEDDGEEGKRTVRVVYEMALEISKQAAHVELLLRSPSSASSVASQHLTPTPYELRTQSSALYRQSILLVESLLDMEDEVSDSDRTVLEKFLASLWGRVGGVEKIPV